MCQQNALLDPFDTLLTPPRLQSHLTYLFSHHNFTTQSEYSTSTKTKKVAITRSIVEHIQTRLTPPGRFLEKDQASGAWKEVETKRAHEKTAQALRDGAAPLRKRLSVEITSDPLFLLDNFEKGDVNSRPAKKPRKSVSAEHLRLPSKGKKEQVHDNSNQQWLSTRGAPLISPSPSPVTSVNEFDLPFHLLDPRGDPFPIDVVDMLDDDILRLWDTC